MHHIFLLLFMRSKIFSHLEPVGRTGLDGKEKI